MTDEYQYLDWGPTTWALLLMSVALFTIAVIGLFVFMVYRACETTTEPTTQTVAPSPEIQESRSESRVLSHHGARA